MTQTTYEQFKKLISLRIHDKTGWSFSNTYKIAKDLVDAVKAQGSWNRDLDIGSYNISGYQSLREFLDYLGNSSFGFSENDKRELIRKWRSTSAIEALTSFLELRSYSFLGYRKSFWQQAYTKISNAPAAIKARTNAAFNRLKTVSKTTLTDLRIKMSQLSSITKFMYSIMSAIGLIGTFGFDNEVIIAGIPLGSFGIGSPTSVQEIEIAHSNKIVKFRAIGSIFLAHQVGGKDTISITGKLTGDLRMYFLAVIWILTLISQGRLETITNIKDTQGEPLVQALRKGVGPLIRINKLPISSKESIATQKPTYEKHTTFPVITQHEIITNAYIETFSFEEKIETGRDVITYNLLMRTYEEPDEFIADNIHSVYRQAKGKTRSQQILKYITNFTYRMLKWSKEFYYLETNAWKTDNYYDVDVVDMGTAFAISLMGVSQ